MRTCNIEGCDGRHEARGLCKKHYRRWQRLTEPWTEQRHERAKRSSERYREQQRQRYLRRKDKKAANNAVMIALTAGRLAKQPCAECGEPKVQAHHEDYAKPLDVIWLCHRCHTDFHMDEGRVVSNVTNP